MDDTMQLIFGIYSLHFDQELYLKKLIFSLLCMVSLHSEAQDLSQEHEKICSRADVVKLMGPKGSCRMLIVSENKTETQGVCQGIFGRSMLCRVTYLISDEATGMQLICGQNLQKPEVQQVVAAKADIYKVSAIVTQEDGTQTIVNDENINTTLESNLMTVILSKKEEESKGQIFLNLKTGPVALTQVQCL
jgi:hypothetical protein